MLTNQTGPQKMRKNEKDNITKMDRFWSNRKLQGVWEIKENICIFIDDTLDDSMGRMKILTRLAVSRVWTTHECMCVWLLLWPWPWPNDLDIRICAKRSEDTYQKWSLYVNVFNSTKRYRQTDRQTYSHGVTHRLYTRVRTRHILEQNDVLWRICRQNRHNGIASWKNQKN